MNEFCRVEEAIAQLSCGGMIILVDDEDRENEGDLIVLADHATPEAINFMAKHARGLICLSMTAEDTKRLDLPQMVEHNLSQYETAFTVSVEAATGVTTGISAFDRARTIAVALDPESSANDLVRPGHVFPLQARDGGVLVRAGHTEGGVDLARLAGANPTAVICEIMREDGHMAKLPDLIEFAKQHTLPILTINELIAYRMQHECLVEEIASSHLPIREHGEFRLRIFKSPIDGVEHTVLQRGEIQGDVSTLVRVHSECQTGDVFGSLRCDCGWQLDAALERIAKEGGVLLYMRQEGRGIGLANKVRAYALQEKGMDTVEANLALGFSEDHRDYGIGSQILRYLGIRSMRLLTNNPRKFYGLAGYGLTITSREPLRATPNSSNAHYLQTKAQKLGHWLKEDKNVGT